MVSRPTWLLFRNLQSRIRSISYKSKCLCGRSPDCAMQLNCFRTVVNTALLVAKPMSKHFNCIKCLCRCSPKWMQAYCVEQYNGFNIWMHLFLNSPMSTHFRWCKCLGVISPNGHRTIMLSRSMVGRPTCMLFLELVSQCRSISDCIIVCKCAFPDAPEQVHEAFQWFQYLVECRS